MSTPTRDVIAKLTSFGSKTGEFIQTQRLQQSSVASGQVDEGFCQGVCTDWTRRILQGGKPAYSNARSKIEGQTFRQATIQLNVESRSAKMVEVNRLANRLIDLYNAQIPIYNRDNRQDQITLTVQLQNEVLKYLTFETPSNRKYNFKRVLKWSEILGEVQDSYNHKTVPGWAALVDMMDKYHLQKRREESRSGSSRPFSHIKILESTDRQTYGNGSIQAALSALFKVAKFVPDTVMIMGFGLRVNGRDSGHAVAVNKRSDGNFYFLDPNYGVFSYNMRGQLSALIYLFGGGPAIGGPIYGEDFVITGGVNYTLFGPA